MQITICVALLKRGEQNFLEERQLPTNKYFDMESVNKIKSLVSSQAEKTKADTFDLQFFGGW